MSDTFDHEGDAWESEADRELDYLLSGYCGAGRASPLRQIFSCKHCGSIDVFWVETSQGWRLFNQANSTPHLCRHKSASADDFEVVSPDVGR
jgi:hypothetical protein